MVREDWRKRLDIYQADLWFDFSGCVDVVVIDLVLEMEKLRFSRSSNIIRFVRGIEL